MSTDEIPSFFIPEISPEEQEDVYAGLAATIRRSVLPISERIYSITFSSKAEIWTATVGRQLRGTRTSTHRSRGRTVERTTRLIDNSVVMAIFPGVPFHVWHNGASQTWANPFLTGEPLSIVRFTAE